MNKRLFIAKGLSFVPQGISDLLYRFVVMVVIFFLSKKEMSVWARNSFVLDRIQPFLSDIDFTLFFAANTNESDKIKSIRRYHLLRKWLPILGELNVYSDEDRDLLLRNINQYELLRDPILLKKINSSKSTKDNLPEKIAFLFRMFHSDRKSLRDYPKLREKKWRGHFSDLQISSPKEINLQTVQRYILDSIPFDKEAKGKLDAQMKEFYSLLDSGQKDWSIPDQMSSRDIIWAFYPQIFCYQSGHFVQGNSFLREICKFQIKWEITGCLTQYMVTDQRKSLQAHISRLIYYNREIKLDSEIRADLDLSSKKIRDKLIFGQNDEEIKAIIAQRPISLLQGKLQKIIFFLKDKNPKKILEIGSFAGGSAYVLAKNFSAAEIISVDKNNFNEYFQQLDHHDKIFNYVTLQWPEIKWEYDSMLRTQKMYESMCSNLQFRSVHDKIEKIGPFDIVIVDGDHTPEALWSDLQFAYNNIKSGYIFVDDCSYQHIREASKKFCSQFNLKWELIWWDWTKTEDMMVIAVHSNLESK